MSPPIGLAPFIRCALQRPKFTITRPLTTTARLHKWEGRPTTDHAARTQDPLNAQHSAAKEGMKARAKGEGGSATSEAADGGGGNKTDSAGEAKDNTKNNSTGDKQGDREGFKGDLNKQAEKDFPKAPRPVIGMNDERGGNGR